LRARIAAKASLDLLDRIDGYVEHLEAASFAATEWRVGRRIVPAWFFEESWRRHRGLPFTERVARVVEATEHQIGIHYNHDLRTDERRLLREAVRGMARRTTPRAAYKKLFEWMERPELFRPTAGRLEYADVFPLIYLRMRLEGVENPRKDVKHLLVDEMQDYTPVQYAVLGKLFACRKTVLGDASQSVNPYGASSAEQIQRVLRPATGVTLTKSYRSTWEIMQFALAISPNAELVAMKRHGEPPRVLRCERPSDVRDRIVGQIEDFSSSSHRSLAIIAKTQKQAAKLHGLLAQAGAEARLLDADSAGFSTGVIVCTAHLAKGLEFDRVVVADASTRNYHTELDRRLLYVACTRAMHRLTLVAVGEVSGFLPAPPSAGREQE